MSQSQKNVGVFTFALIFTFIAMYVMFSATWAGTAGGLLAASVMTGFTLIAGLLTLALQQYRQKAAFASKQKSTDDMASHQSRTIEIDLPFEQAFDSAGEALHNLDGEAIPATFTGIPGKQILKIHKENRDIGRIEAGLRAKTAGIQDFIDFSRIEIQLQRINENTTRLQIDSRPTNPLEGFDLGRHTHYVNQLALSIRQMSHEALAEARLTDEQSGDVFQDNSAEGRRQHKNNS